MVSTRQEKLIIKENGGLDISKPPLFKKGRKGKLEKVISLAGKEKRVSRISTSSNSIVGKNDSSHDLFELNWLKSQKWPRVLKPKRTIRSCDLFSGCGGITMGLWEACRNYEMKLEVVMGCDLFDAAEHSFVANFKPEFFLNEPIENYVNGELGAELTPEEILLKERLGEIDVVVGGPPCQGNSNLNNHTRRTDSRNELYMRMIRFIEVIQPNIALIENVSGVMRAKQNVVQRSNEYLNNLGYVSRHGVVRGVQIGIPQTRVRHFTVAVKGGNNFSFAEVGGATLESPRPVSWAIADLLGIDAGEEIFDNPPSPGPVNQRRMDYLFEHGIYNLPNKERPPCQQKAHTYPAIYSRMWWDKPAPTLTTGFGCNGRGRFTHPKEARVLTPHEAARVQTFPDFFDFSIIKKRTDLHRLIGNAVPPLMATHVLTPLLGNFLRLQEVDN